MARSFDDGSSQYLTVASVVVSSAPVTMACWMYNDDVTVNQCAICTSDPTTDVDGYTLLFRGATVGDPIEWRVDGASSTSCQTTTGVSANTWHHIAGVSAAINDHRVYIDGGSKGTSAANGAPSSPTNTSIARLYRSIGEQYYWTGRLADVAVWNVALSDEEVAALADGASPLTIHPQNLVAYWPLVRDEDQDIVGGYDMTPQNGPTIATHPPEVIPALYRPRGWVIPAVVGSESASVSPSESPSPSPGVSAPVVWGHDTGVLEANVRDFDGNWTGTGTIENPGVADTERLALEAGEYMISEMVNTGSVTVQLLQNEYQSGDDVTMEYRHGNTPNACAAASWNGYVTPFLSDGYVEIRLTSTL